MRKTSLCIAVCAMALSACAGKMDAQRGLSEEWRLRSLEENFLNFKETQRESEERGRDQQRKLSERVRALEETVAAMQGGAPLAPAPKASGLAPAPAASSPAVSQALASIQAEQGAKPAAPPVQKSLYDQGMNMVRLEQNPAEGRRLLLEFMDTDPQSALTPNALYWVGESLYQEKNYAQAILTFKDVTRRFPKHHKAAAALYKIGLSYAMMGEKDNASLYLRALLKEHPKSEPAPAARKKLAELGG